MHRTIIGCYSVPYHCAHAHARVVCLQAIEAEVESKEGMQAAYSQHSQGPAAGQRQQCSQPGSMLSESPELTNKLQQVRATT